MAKTIPQMKFIEAPTLEDFIILFNDTMMELADCNPRLQEKNGNTAIIMYDVEVDEIEEENPYDGRYCCECARYDWGKGCPYRTGVVRLKDQACKKFTITVEVE